LTAHGPDEDPPSTPAVDTATAGGPAAETAFAEDVQRTLVRAESAGHRDLAARTGLARLALDEVRLAPGERRPFPAGLTAGKAEAFLYVVAGNGALTANGTTHTIAAGDFLGIGAPTAPMALANTGSGALVCLLGSGG
jgi:uncharacterized cupin superfamily protein